MVGTSTLHWHIGLFHQSGTEWPHLTPISSHDILQICVGKILCQTITYHLNMCLYFDNLYLFESLNLVPYLVDVATQYANVSFAYSLNC